MTLNNWTCQQRTIR